MLRGIHLVTVMVDYLFSMEVGLHTLVSRSRYQLLEICSVNEAHASGVARGGPGVVSYVFS